MKNKIKKFGYGVASTAMMLTPVAVMAQFSKPSGTQLPTGSIYNIIKNFMLWILALVGIFGIIGFAIAGILYLTAAGNEEQIERAKRAMLMSIVGVIVALVGWVIIQAVQKWLQGGGNVRF